MEYPHPGGAYAPAFKTTDGSRVEAEPGQAGSVGGTKLVNGTTYVFMLGGSDAPLESVHLKWDAAVVVTFTLETSNYPDREVPNYDTTIAGGWVQENPSTAYIGVSPGGSGTPTNLTLVVAGGTAGGAMLHLGNLGSKRQRVRALVGGTGGYVSVLPHGKR